MICTYILINEHIAPQNFPLYCTCTCTCTQISYACIMHVGIFRLLTVILAEGSIVYSSDLHSYSGSMVAIMSTDSDTGMIQYVLWYIDGCADNTAILINNK